jgi:uncharacterized protein with PQ loop repeat
MILKTTTNIRVKNDNNANLYILFMIALNTFISYGIPTNKLNRWIMYHYLPLILPRIDIIKKNRIELNYG